MPIPTQFPFNDIENSHNHMLHKFSKAQLINRIIWINITLAISSIIYWLSLMYIANNIITEDTIKGIVRIFSTLLFCITTGSAITYILNGWDSLKNEDPDYYNKTKKLLNKFLFTLTIFLLICTIIYMFIKINNLKTQIEKLESKEQVEKILRQD